MAKDCCISCGKKWVDHGGIMVTCSELRAARKQLADLRILFFVLCLKYLPPKAEFTPYNLLSELLKRKR